jgi:hypothetical protein
MILELLVVERCTLISIISPSVMSLLLLYLEILGIGCFRFGPSSLLSYFPLVCQGVDVKMNHQGIHTTHLHASRCHHWNYCCYCDVDFVLFIMLHATLVLYYHDIVIVCTITCTQSQSHYPHPVHTPTLVNFLDPCFSQCNSKINNSLSFKMTRLVVSINSGHTLPTRTSNNSCIS